MNVFKDTLVPVALFCLLAIETYAQTTADDRQLFAFEFQTNQPLVYAFWLKTRTVTDNNIGGKPSLTKNTTETRCKVRLTGFRKNADGTTSVHFKPYHIEDDVDIVGPNHVVTQVRGLKIKSL